MNRNTHGLLPEKDDTVSVVLEALNTDERYGIIGDRRDLERRQEYFGKNIKPTPLIAGFLF